MPLNAFAPPRKSLISGTDKAMSSPPGPLIDCRRYTSRSPSRCGSGLSSTPLTTLKIAVFAPIPSPSVRTTAMAKPRARERLRSAYRRSERNMAVDPEEDESVGTGRRRQPTSICRMGSAKIDNRVAGDVSGPPGEKVRDGPLRAQVIYLSNLMQVSRRRDGGWRSGSAWDELLPHLDRERCTRR